MARTNMIGVRVTAEERAAFDSAAAEAGKSTSDWLRSLGEAECARILAGGELVRGIGWARVVDVELKMGPGPAVQAGPEDLEW